MKWIPTTNNYNISGAQTNGRSDSNYNPEEGKSEYSEKDLEEQWNEEGARSSVEDASAVGGENL